MAGGYPRSHSRGVCRVRGTRDHCVSASCSVTPSRRRRVRYSSIARRSGVIVHSLMAWAEPGAVHASYRPWRRSQSCSVADNAARRRCPRARRPVAAGRSPVNDARRARPSAARSPPLVRALRTSVLTVLGCPTPRCGLVHAQDSSRVAARSIVTQIRDQCFADIRRQRQLTADRSLPAHRQRTRVPIDVIELESHDSPPRWPSRAGSSKMV
jgi:hypothetical protein